ncbi:hypothetical protein K2173_023742 [Erythroxylum novogranatense]|uniref:Epidermal patterning factor-like protein n=1 Tax=Erythroxylum novogranatense TaxID=1862640 RepID=A0AAV8TPW9_9ROSI|nr:hypothetical protein K2173_023742 [Erythroxylum novogranatense]
MGSKTNSRSKLRFINKPSLLYCVSIFFFFLSFCALFTSITSTVTCIDPRCSLSGKADIYFQDLERRKDEMTKEASLNVARRVLSGLGSSPPHCGSKCGKCTPCQPVHVPVPPGTPVTAEYYPEAWRCKCGNKLYMP